MHRNNPSKQISKPVDKEPQDRKTPPLTKKMMTKTMMIQKKQKTQRQIQPLALTTLHSLVRMLQVLLLSSWSSCSYHLGFGASSQMKPMATLMFIPMTWSMGIPAVIVAGQEAMAISTQPTAMGMGTAMDIAMEAVMTMILLILKALSLKLQLQVCLTS